MIQFEQKMITCLIQFYNLQLIILAKIQKQTEHTSHTTLTHTNISNNNIYQMRRSTPSSGNYYKCRSCLIMCRTVLPYIFLRHAQALRAIKHYAKIDIGNQDYQPYNETREQHRHIQHKYTHRFMSNQLYDNNRVNEEQPGQQQDQQYWQQSHQYINLNLILIHKTLHRTKIRTLTDAFVAILAHSRSTGSIANHKPNSRINSTGTHTNISIINKGGINNKLKSTSRSTSNNKPQQQAETQSRSRSKSKNYNQQQASTNQASGEQKGMENKSSVKLSNISISITVPNGNGSVGTNNVGGYLPINSKPKNQLDHKNGNGRENTQVRPMLIPQVQCLISIAQILNSMWKQIQCHFFKMLILHSARPRSNQIQSGNGYSQQKPFTDKLQLSELQDNNQLQLEQQESIILSQIKSIIVTNLLNFRKNAHSTNNSPSPAHFKQISDKDQKEKGRDNLDDNPTSQAVTHSHSQTGTVTKQRQKQAKKQQSIRWLEAILSVKLLEHVQTGFRNLKWSMVEQYDYQMVEKLEMEIVRMSYSISLIPCEAGPDSQGLQLSSDNIEYMEVRSCRPYVTLQIQSCSKQIMISMHTPIYCYFILTEIFVF